MHLSVVCSSTPTYMGMMWARWGFALLNVKAPLICFADPLLSPPYRPHVGVVGHVIDRCIILKVYKISSKPHAATQPF